MSLYTKYRPRDWDSIIGQDAIVTILRTSLQNNAVGHAYLFTGSRGTGKTSSARILAKGINCRQLQNGNPCHMCPNCQAFDDGSMIDVVEIDAASNSGIDHTRNLIEKAKFEPSQGKYKIYIIDEVHMLSDSAFNALLKTIEEPPAHVKFILATTEVQEVPETIRSRTLRFDFKKITDADIMHRLQFVINEEGITADAQALELIARTARGGLRDALSLLEQNIVNQHVSAEQVKSTLSLIDDDLIETILDALRDENTDALLTCIHALQERSIDARGCLDQILYALRDRMLQDIRGTHFTRYQEIFYWLRDAYSSVRIISDGMLILEMTFWALMSPIAVLWKKEWDQKWWSSHQKDHSISSPIEHISWQWWEVREQNIPHNTHDPITTSKEATPPEKNPPNSDHFSYRELLNALKNEWVILAALKTASFQTTQNALQLTLASKWHHEKLNTPRSIEIIRSHIEKLFWLDWDIQIHLGVLPPHDHTLDDIFL